jgi:hypothetical protein
MNDRYYQLRTILSLNDSMLEAIWGSAMTDIGKGYGCGVAVIVAGVPILPLAFVLGWSGAHCDPAPTCQRSAEWHAGLIFVGTLLFAMAIGYALRKLLNGMATKREDGGYAAVFSITATALSLIAVVVALGLLYTVAFI